VADGSALATYERWVEAQGGNPAEDALEEAPLVKTLTATESGYVGALRALPVGLAALHLGAGRATKDDAIDYAVGIVCRKKRGDAVAIGEPLADIHARTEAQAETAARDVAAAYELRPEPPPTTPIVLESIG
jgi:thymidine phosphorylase